MVFKSINPFDQSVIGEFPLHDDGAIAAKLEVAGRAYKSWRREPIDNRAHLMLSLAAILRHNKEQYARNITVEMGKVISEARNEIEKCAITCEYFAHNGAGLLNDTVIRTEAKRAYISYHPTGAVFGIMPWNFPWWQVFRYAVPTLLGGNVAVLKHAPNVCGVALEIEQAFRDAGFPEGVFQSLIVDVNKAERIIASDLVQGVTLTGSEYAGSQVAALAGKHIKKSVMELGGSDAFIVLEDADLDKAAKIATQSRMQNAGQSCIASKRFIVIDKVHDAFLARLQRNVAGLTPGNPLDENTTIAPLARIDLAEKLEQQMHASVAAGAVALNGGERRGCYFAPAILDGVTSDMRAFREETFGPLAAVIAARSETHAIELANQSRYGLGCSVWTQDYQRAEYLATQLEVGGVFVNSLVRSDARWPFGGVRKSGYGRELAEAGLKEFLNIKAVIME